LGAINEECGDAFRAFVAACKMFNFLFGEWPIVVPNDEQVFNCEVVFQGGKATTRSELAIPLNFRRAMAIAEGI